MLTRLMLSVLLTCSWPIFDCFSQEPQTRVLTLAESVELALQNNPLIEAAGTSLDLAYAKRVQASHARYLPRFTLRQVVGPIPRLRGIITPGGGVITPDTSNTLADLRVFTQVDLDIIQPLWTFGKLGSIRDAAASGVEAGEANVVVTMAEVQLQVRKLYWGLVLGYELLDVVEDMLEEVTDAQNKIETKLDEDSDEVSQTDLFQMQIVRYEVAKRRRDALHQIELAKAALRVAIGLDDPAEFDLATRSLERVQTTVDSLSTYIAMALRNRPELAQLRAGVDARSSLVRASTSDYFPQFFVAAQIQFNRAADRFDPRNPFVYNPTNFFRPGIIVGMNWNLNFVQTRDKVRIARVEESVLAQKEPFLMDGIKLDVREAYLAVKQSEQDILESRKALRASDNWLRSETQTFDLGIGNVNDVIDAFRANGSMRGEHLQNIFRFNTSLAELSKAVGRDLYPN